VRSIPSRTRSEEADDGSFGGSEGVRVSELCWKETAAGEVEERGRPDAEVSAGVEWGIVLSEAMGMRKV
jgi:hypothetical protein